LKVDKDNIVSLQDGIYGATIDQAGEIEITYPMTADDQTTPLIPPEENEYNIQAVKHYVFNETGNIMMLRQPKQVTLSNNRSEMCLQKSPCFLLQ